MTFGTGLANSATLDVFSVFAPSIYSQNILTLQAILNGKVVTSESISFDTIGAGIMHQFLSVSGTDFNQLQLIASGPEDDGAVFVGMDNVTINAADTIGPVALVPEPGSSMLFVVGFVLLAGNFGRRALRKSCFV
jgi:hypothetical protein